VALAFAVAFAIAAALPVHAVIAVAVGAVLLFAGLVALRVLPEEFLQAIRLRPGG
jgi:hypothetical protein